MAPSSHSFSVGDYVRARFWMTDEDSGHGRWSDLRRSFRVTSSDPLTGVEIYQVSPGSYISAQEYRLSPDGAELRAEKAPA